MKKLFIFMILSLMTYSTDASAYSVYYNTNSKIYHDHQCEWARKCTKNCITLDHTEAKQYGGRPCKVCGG